MSAANVCAIEFTREEVGYLIDAVATLTRATDIDNPYPALLRRLQGAYRIQMEVATDAD